MNELEQDLEVLQEKADRLKKLQELTQSDIDITINTTIGEILNWLPSGCIISLYHDGSWNIKSNTNEKYKLPSGSTRGVAKA